MFEDDLKQDATLALSTEEVNSSTKGHNKMFIGDP
jgi:hypothetical protein